MMSRNGSMWLCSLYCLDALEINVLTGLFLMATNRDLSGISLHVYIGLTRLTVRKFVTSDCLLLYWKAMAETE